MKWVLWSVLASALVLVGGVLAPAGAASGSSEVLRPVPRPRLEGTETEVRELIEAQHETLDRLRQQAGVPREVLAEAYGDLGRLYLAYQFSEAAEACLQNAIDLAPMDVRWSYYLGLLDLEHRRFERAAEDFQRVLEGRPHDSGALLRLGEVWLGLDQVEQAQEAYGRALALDDSLAAAHYGLGRVALIQGDDQAAVERLERALALQPTARRLHYLLARAYQRLGQPERAAQHAEQYAPVDLVFPEPLVAEMRALATDAEFHIASADRAAASGHYAFAERAYRRALELDPQNPKALQGLGACLEQKGDLEGALEQYAAAVRQEPENPRRRLHLGRLQAVLGNQTEAVAELEEAIRLDPGNEPALLQLASLLTKAGDYQGAIEIYDRILARAPQHRVALLQKPLALKQAGRLEEARAGLERAVEIAPGDPTARINLATVLLELEAYDRAAKELRTVLAAGEVEAPIRALALYNLGVIRTREGQDQEAIRRFGEAVELDPELVAARFHLANARARQGEYGVAAEQYDEVIRREPDHLPARLAQATALALAGRCGRALDRIGEGLQALPGELNLTHTLARLLVTCPDPQLRDGQRALELALKVFSAQETMDHAETVAMAYAEVGAFDDAVRWQSKLLAEAERLGAQGWVERLALNLERYRRGEPSLDRPPR